MVRVARGARVRGRRGGGLRIHARGTRDAAAFAVCARCTLEALGGGVGAPVARDALARDVPVGVDDGCLMVVARDACFVFCSIIRIPS